MTLAKRLLLGSAAALVATTGAQAADLGLPVAPAVDYVQICSVGSFTGFLLPGSDVCFDINGFARFQTDFDGDRGDNDDWDMEGIFELNFDARTMTEYGLLRGFIRIDGTGGNNGDGTVQLQKAFVQFGGLTAGYTDSFFDMVYTDYAIGNINVPDGGSTDLALIGYAFSVGNGITLMASLEEQNNRNYGSFYDADNGMPDVVLAARVDQAWGSAKLSGAIHDVDPDAAGVDSEFGFAIGASAEFNLPVGTGSNFGIFGIYTNGALGYIGGDDALGSAVLADAVVNGTELEMTDAYAFGAGVDFGVTSNVDLELDAYYANIDQFDIAGDISLWAVRGSVAYVPVAGLQLRAGVGYTDYDVDADPDLDGEWGARFRITRSF